MKKRERGGPREAVYLYSIVLNELRSGTKAAFMFLSFPCCGLLNVSAAQFYKIGSRETVRRLYRLLLVPTRSRMKTSFLRGRLLENQMQ